MPRGFHYGILVAGVCSNWADLPTAVIMSITASAPFTSGDSDVAVAYLSAFIFVLFITMFPLGGHHVIAMDFADGARQADVNDEALESAAWWSRRPRWREAAVHSDVERVAQHEISSETDEKDSEAIASCPRTGFSCHLPSDPPESTTHNGHECRQSTRPPSAHVSPSPTVAEGIISSMSQDQKPPPGSLSSELKPISITNESLSRLRRAFMVTRAFLITFASPVTTTMLVSLVIALIPALKALFISPPAGSNVHIGSAPDGLPPLNIILDTATFIGNGSVPLGLICLGSALARLQVSRPISRAPIGAITALSILKMVLGPVVGVIIVEALTHHTTLIDPNDKVLRFVCILYSAMPTSTTQVFLTQAYSPDGSADHIAIFLIPQYALMLITITALSAYSLKILF